MFFNFKYKNTIKMKYKKHPRYKDVYVREDGKEVVIDHKPCAIYKKYHKKNCPIMLVNVHGFHISLPRLVLETYGEPLKKDKRYYAKCIDGNIENTHPENLKWVSMSWGKTEIGILKRACSSSSIPQSELKNISREYARGMSLSKLGSLYNVSPTTIARALKRYNKMLKLNLI